RLGIHLGERGGALVTMVRISPPTLSLPPGRRWHQVYFALAALAVASVASTLWLTYDYGDSHSDLVARSREWANRMDAYNHLSELAVAVDAPGNDVFETHDVVAERARVAAAL